jgi:hypothetical protein
MDSIDKSATSEFPVSASSQLLSDLNRREIQAVIEAEAENRRHRYPALRVVERIVKSLGYGLGLVAVISIITMFSDSAPILRMVATPSFLMSVVASALLIAFGELIQVLIDIEFNTRKTYVEQEVSNVLGNLTKIA